MTCEITRQQLLELPVWRFGELSAHLSVCADCRALAERIVTQGEQVDTFVEDYAGADTFDAALGAARRARAPRSRRRAAFGGLVALAAAAALVLAVRGSPPPEQDRTPGVSPVPDRAGESPVEGFTWPETLAVEVGQSAHLPLPYPIWGAVVDDPLVAEVIHEEGGGLRLVGKKQGETLLRVTLDPKGRERQWRIEVAGGTNNVEIQLGSYSTVGLSMPSRVVSVDDPEVVAARIDGTTLVFLAGKAGRTRVVTECSDSTKRCRAIWTVTVHE